MRVAVEIDASNVVRGGTLYVRYLVSELARIAPEHEYLFFGFQFGAPTRLKQQFPLPDSPRVRYCIPRWPQSLVGKLEWGLGLPLIETYLSAVQRCDVFHSFRLKGPKVCLTVPDVSPLLRDDWTTPETLRVFHERAKPAIAAAKRIVTYSQATRKHLIEMLGVPDEKIRVTPLGIDRAIFNPISDSARLEAVRAKYRLPKRFLLMVGPFDMAADFKSVVAALKGWRGERPNLVCVGPVDGYVQGLQKLAAEAGVADCFTWPGYVWHKELVDVYNLADALVYPSLLPGIELPPMEAIACGRAVVTTLPETVGDAGLVVEMESSDQLREAMRKVWESESVRQELGRKGLARAAEMTWERCARTTLAAYKEVAGL